MCAIDGLKVYVQRNTLSYFVLESAFMDVAAGLVVLACTSVRLSNCLLLVALWSICALLAHQIA
jgi:hypothetical protein